MATSTRHRTWVCRRCSRRVPTGVRHDCPCAAPPADFVDDVVVERLVDGLNPGRKPTTAERRAAVRHLITVRDWGTIRTARHLGVCDYTVLRDKEALGLGAYADRNDQELAA